MTRFLSLFLLASALGNAQQDLKSTYKPLRSSGELPPVFTQNIRNIIKQDISELRQRKENDKSLKSTYLTASNYQIERIIRGGNTIVNDEVTKYLNQITDLILKDNPSLRKQLSVYTLKSSVVNAYSFDKGYTFINIGLIAQAETEAQLAYIICHEISHYTRQHHINSYVKNAKIDRGNYDGSSEDRLIEKCQYSKENESEADLEGFKLFEQTRYNLKQAEKGFDVLQYSHLPFELVEFKKSWFETPDFIIPQRYFLKEVSAIKDNSNEDDTKRTHPNTKKRKLAIAELIRNRDNSNRVNSILGQDQFEYIRDLSRMELCRLYLKNRDYPNALYAAYILSSKYPNNDYLAEIVSKCMYGIALAGNGSIHYNEDSRLSNGIPSYSDIESFPQQLYHLINKMPSNEWTIMSLNYVYRTHKKFPENKKIAGISDSLFKMMEKTKWGLTDFTRVKKKEELPDIKKDTAVITGTGNPASKTDLIATLQKETSTRTDDTVYYKNIFVDLFINDPEFTAKFPYSGGNSDQPSGNTFYSYSVSNRRSYSSRKSRNINSEIKIEKVLLLEPFYLKLDETRREEVQYIASDEKQEKYTNTINQCANILKFQLITIDPGLVNKNEVDKINDYSVINDWFDERFDGEDEKNLILNTDDVDNVISKYGTQYVLKTGVATVINVRGKKRTFFYGFLFDLKRNELVYRKYEYFRSKDHKDLVNAKTYQMLYELKHPIKR